LLDASDNNDPTARVTTLMALADPAAGLADLRSASLTGQRGGLTVRDLELALGPAEPLPGESVPPQDGVVQAVAGSLAGAGELAGTLQGGYDAAQALATAGRRASGSGTDEASVGASAAASAASRPPGTISSREDASRTLERVCEWIERNEPTNPAPLLIRRAQRLMSKSFIDIIRDLAPDGVKEIEKLAGSANS
jgi:type VI secretion system protein ImpA